ncbi:MAG: invasion associated locus B family protein [Alphaproteobacteria bacterium]|jgi:invasion protein IalB|nr:invasion associated locus B family protein [Alphaproteobacteria bacterium]MBU1561446.1 invasion associated locus B family protein [Alphaproteobacteria bacterium]MBU2302566.1 invasion associated locus B family protein [Alphaproteobacteria bacterium]MBU2367554.1 invasion associated locus B family protein [Alphaproteobacteria bacterium]
MNFRKPLVAGIAVAALMLSPLSAFAQDAAPAEAPAAEAPADAPAATDAAAAPADAAAAGSQNWLKVCDPLPDGQKACIMRQVVLANGQFLGSFLLRDDPGQESRLLAVAAVPLGVLLPFGLTWQIDGAKPIRVPYMLCDPTSCATQLVINEQYVNSLKKGGTLKLTAKNRQNQDLTIDITLAGFTAAYDGEAALTFEEFRQETSGENALEQVLQDRAEQLRQQLDGGAAAPAEGTETPAAPAAQ